MIFPRDEKLKYEQLQAKLDRLTASCKKMDIFTYYNEKFETIVLCASQKIIKRTEKVELNKDTSSYSGWRFLLTGSGIRQVYGYGERHRRPQGFWLNAFITGFGYGPKEQNANLAELLKGVESIKEIAAIPARVDELRQIFADIKATKFYGESNASRNIDLSENITLGTPIEIQQSEEIEEQEDGNEDANSFKAHRIEVQLVDSDIDITIRKNKSSDIIFQIKEHLKVSDFIRISEPAIYDVITKLVDALILKVDTKVEAKTKELIAVVQKYGQYICYKEL